MTAAARISSGRDLLEVSNSLAFESKRPHIVAGSRKSASAARMRAIAWLSEVPLLRLKVRVTYGSCPWRAIAVGALAKSVRATLLTDTRGKIGRAHV